MKGSPWISSSHRTQVIINASIPGASCANVAALVGEERHAARLARRHFRPHLAVDRYFEMLTTHRDLHSRRETIPRHESRQDASQDGRLPHGDRRQGVAQPPLHPAVAREAQAGMPPPQERRDPRTPVPRPRADHEVTQ